MKFLPYLICVLAISCTPQKPDPHALVFQSDFSLKDGAVSAMKGVAFAVSPSLPIYDITHEITPYNIMEGAYRLKQSAGYWPEGTVFVSIVDPGVGSKRKSVVMKSGKGHYFVTPDNGTLSYIAELEGIAEVREIDETKNRLPGSGDSYTFHGRDVYAYTGARLAAGVITFEEVGPSLGTDIVRLPELKPVVEGSTANGHIPVLDIQYGNVWTDIDRATLDAIGIKTGDRVKVVVWKGTAEVYNGTMPLVTTFSGVGEGEPLCYLNSLLNLSLALHEGNFATKFGVSSGPEWTIAVSKAN